MTHAGRDASAQTRVDMEQARKRTTLNVVATRDFLHGGKEQCDLYKNVVDVVSSDPVLRDSRAHRYFMSRKDVFRNSLMIQCRLNELAEKHAWTGKEASIAAGACGEAIATNLHAVAFEPVVLSQGSPEMIEEFGSMSKNRAILGCYLQTELGHGTNVQGLETTATYLPETDEFDIHSPTLTSTKWWIGGLGKTATHGVVQAQLILPGGKNMGPHLFLVQLRSLEDHSAMPGIKLGDIGPKAMGAMGGLDNGFARFKHYRIPRSQMLSRYAQVTKEGKYVKPLHAKMSYGGMLYIRSTMVSSAGHVLAKAVVIAIRYCTVRRQGNRNSDGLEEQVINYPSVHQRLLPVLSRAYVFSLLGRSILRSFDGLSSRLNVGDASILSDMHAMTSGLKVLVSTMSVQDIETCRRSMGGHGYSAFAGVGKLYAEYLPSATFEGDNFVLDQQVVRAALKSHQFALSGEVDPQLSPFSSYLRLLLPGSEPLVINMERKETWHDWKTLILVLEWRAALLVSARVRSSPDAYSDQRVSRAVTDAFVAAQVGEMIQALTLCGPDKLILTKLFTLYLLCTVEAALLDLVSLGLMSGKQTRTSVSTFEDCTTGVRLAFSKCCRDLLPEAIGLSDAFGLTDWELDSSLGVYDGRVYESLWSKALSEPLNADEVTEWYPELIKPILDRGRRLSDKESKAKL